MKKLELNQMENLEGGKFWGWGGISWGPCSGGWQSGVSNYYALLMVVDHNVHVRPC